VTKNLLDPHIVHDPKSNDLCYRGRLTQKIFFSIFHTFTRGTTDLCLPFIENAKKSTPPTVKYARMKSLFIMMPAVHSCKHF
jgi:hypothetical protein